jgi:phage/plasmid-associated DNA primase
MTTSPETESCYIYDETAGHYKPFNEAQLRIFVVQVLSDIGLKHFLSQPYMVKVASNLLVFTGDLTGPKHNRHLIAFENGVLDLKTKQLQPHGPQHWVLYKLPYLYDLSAKAPVWEQYIHHLCSGQVDRVETIRAWLWCLLRGWMESQTMMHVYGPGGTGKTVLALVATALVGKENTVTTSNTGFVLMSR